MKKLIVLSLAFMLSLTCTMSVRASEHEKITQKETKVFDQKEIANVVVSNTYNIEIDLASKALQSERETGTNAFSKAIIKSHTSYNTGYGHACVDDNCTSVLASCSTQDTHIHNGYGGSVVYIRLIMEDCQY